MFIEISFSFLVVLEFTKICYSVVINEMLYVVLSENWNKSKL